MATTKTTGRRLRPPSPNINRSRTISSSISLPVSLNASLSSSTSSSSSSSPSNSSKRVMITRSHSTTRSSRPTGSSNPKSGENIIPARNSASRSHEINNGRSREAFAQYLDQRERGSPRNNASSRGVKPGASSPSAWALSSGRVSTMKTYLSSSAPANSMCMTPPESPVSKAKIRSGGGGAVAGVLKYFMAQKKVSPVQEEDYHRFRVLQNRLLQWRFVNARTEATMAKLKINVEDQLFWVWLRIYKMRNYVVENLIEVQRLRQEIKLGEVLSLQMPLLNDWSKLEAKNSEALSKLTRKLHALSVRLPFVHGATMDVVSIHEEMVIAIQVMDEIEDVIIKFLPRVEIILYELTELIGLFNQELLYFEEMDKSLFSIPLFAAKERSLKVHILQKSEEQRKKKLYNNSKVRTCN
ncbi:QWRF motif-containing protein 7 isoform X2 [Arabidopsis lyrata subsp. lyrata]|uniref:QWRF motif-containing protein 7 isoform X2 n=1 Tax=Arabidopsis lyrata subsp. lyrata TaxID=81972 RepID=UPI000A29E49E|nr:QWRF motif-containing protein 7 isoform X2 [Arabidopsis lyrata subsp. lyrata]|eukprot:XP_020873519.1 QWRF motif-containing protein 7 isoform X2 [Arabidopsis lyrata subsp. lyrata]